MEVRLQRAVLVNYIPSDLTINLNGIEYLDLTVFVGLRAVGYRQFLQAVRKLLLHFSKTHSEPINIGNVEVMWESVLTLMHDRVTAEKHFHPAITKAIFDCLMTSRTELAAIAVNTVVTGDLFEIFRLLSVGNKYNSTFQIPHLNYDTVAMRLVTPYQILVIDAVVPIIRLMDQIHPHNSFVGNLQPLAEQIALTWVACLSVKVQHRERCLTSHIKSIVKVLATEDPRGDIRTLVDTQVGNLMEATNKNPTMRLRILENWNTPGTSTPRG